MTTRPLPANDSLVSKGDTTTRLAARVAAIASKSPPSPHFTGL